MSGQQPRFIRAARVPELYGVSRRTLARMEQRDPAFPKPHRLNARLLMFRTAELDAYFSRPGDTQEDTADV